MAIQPWTYQGDVGTHYNGRELVMITHANQALHLDPYPISMTREQFDAIPCVQRVFGILTTRIQLPSIEVGVTNLNIPSVIAINSIFQRALKDYAEAFDQANQDDRSVIERLEQSSSNSFFRFFIHIYRMMSSHHRMVVEKGSAQRYAWMIAVGAYEKQRIQQMKEIIQARSTALILGLQEEHAHGFVNQDSVQELDALERIYRKAAPTTPLVAGGKDVQTFVAPFLHQRLHE
jgi:hypothetical protein